MSARSRKKQNTGLLIPNTGDKNNPVAISAGLIGGILAIALARRMKNNNK